jgi:hypothetical protein
VRVRDTTHSLLVLKPRPSVAPVLDDVNRLLGTDFVGMVVYEDDEDEDDEEDLES